MAVVIDGTSGITTPDLTDSSLTSGRVVYAGTSGNLTGSANLTYGGNILTSTGRVQIYNTSGTDGGFLRLSSTGDASFYDFEVSDALGLEIQQTNTPRITINIDGNIKNWGSISVGNATPTTSGKGITFPATQSASSDANTLDDYEEGTFNPADNSGAGLSLTSSGRYTKVGRLVTLTFSITYPSTANGSNTQITLPFACIGDGGLAIAYTTYGSAFTMYASNNFAVASFANLSGGLITNASMSGKRVDGTITYQT